MSSPQQTAAALCRLFKGQKVFTRLGVSKTKHVCVVNMLDNNYETLYGTHGIVVVFGVAVCGEIQRMHFVFV